MTKQILDMYKAGSTGNVIAEYYDTKTKIKSTTVRKVYNLKNINNINSDAYIMWEKHKRTARFL